MMLRRIKSINLKMAGIIFYNRIVLLQCNLLYMGPKYKLEKKKEPVAYNPQVMGMGKARYGYGLVKPYPQVTCANAYQYLINLL
jgi:hypothetical protein